MVAATTEAARLLLHSGADPRADEGEAGRWLALSAVSVSDSLPALLDLLLQRGWNVDARQRDGQTVLTQAAKNDHAELVRLLLKAGADVNQRCECSGIYGGNHTPLTLATVSSDSSDSGERTMQLLLDAGARVDDASADGTPLVQAARRGSLPRVRLLLTRGADPRRARDADGDTALMHAVKAARDGEMLQALMAAGADAKAPGGGGATALMWAAAFDYGQVAALLLDAGARIEQASQIGRTALMMAAMSGSVEAARLLVLRGARTDPVDRDGRSALALAESRLNGDALLRMRSVLTQPKELR